DPHTWLDPEKVAEEAQIIADKLSKIDSKNKETYQKNVKELVAKAKELTKKYQPIFKAAKQKTFVTQHTAFSYLAKRFGLTQLGIAGISPEQEPSPRQLTEIEEFVKQYKVKTIF
ncbi:Periplasmic solute binding family protein, partial [human gut metagenome]